MIRCTIDAKHLGSCALVLLICGGNATAQGVLRPVNVEVEFSSGTGAAGQYGAVEIERQGPADDAFVVSVGDKIVDFDGGPTLHFPGGFSCSSPSVTCQVAWAMVGDSLLAIKAHSAGNSRWADLFYFVDLRQDALEGVRGPPVSFFPETTVFSVPNLTHDDDDTVLFLRYGEQWATFNWRYKHVALYSATSGALFCQLPFAELTWVELPGDYGTHSLDATVDDQEACIVYDKPSNIPYKVCCDLLPPTVDFVGIVANDDNDNDGVLNASDNCPFTPNSDQANLPAGQDTEGDVCDSDDDGDGVDDLVDNCPRNRNADQADNDDDGAGDICDSCDCSDPPQLVAEPNLIDFGDVTVGESDHRTLLLKNCGQPVRITSIVFSSGSVWVGPGAASYEQAFSIEPSLKTLRRIYDPEVNLGFTTDDLLKDKVSKLGDVKGAFDRLDRAFPTRKNPDFIYPVAAHPLLEPQTIGCNEERKIDIWFAPPAAAEANGYLAFGRPSQSALNVPIKGQGLNPQSSGGSVGCHANSKGSSSSSPLVAIASLLALLLVLRIGRRRQKYTEGEL